MDPPRQKANPWYAIQTTYPSSNSGCNRGHTFSDAELFQLSEHEILGAYKSEKGALRRVWIARASHENFNGEFPFEGDEDMYDEEGYNTDYPPWDSKDLLNGDNDHEVLLDIMRKSEWLAKLKEDAKGAMAEAHAQEESD